MRIRDLFTRRKPQPSDEALKAHAEVTDELKPRAEAAARERRWLLHENGWGPKIEALYRGEA